VLFEGNVIKYYGFFCATLLTPEAVLFLAGSHVTGIDIQRVKVVSWHFHGTAKEEHNKPVRIDDVAVKF
jgi:hypothetical protein